MTKFKKIFKKIYFAIKINLQQIILKLIKKWKIKNIYQ